MMTETVLAYDEPFCSLWAVMSREGIAYASKGFADMVGTTVAVSQPEVRLAPLAEIPGLLGGTANEVVSICLRIRGEIDGQIMLVLACDKALELADLILGEPRGTSQTLGRLERSALGELGNLTCSFFLNAVAAFSGIDARPSPPAVVMGVLTATLQAVAAAHGGLNKAVLMLQATFTSPEREVQAGFWVIPDPVMFGIRAH